DERKKAYKETPHAWSISCPRRRGSPVPPVIFAVRNDIQTAGHSVRHVEERDRFGEVENVLVAETRPAQPLPVLLADRRRSRGQLPREIEDRASARVERSHPIVHDQHLAEFGVAGQTPHRLTVSNK